MPKRKVDSYSKVTNELHLKLWFNLLPLGQGCQTQSKPQATSRPQGSSQANIGGSSILESGCRSKDQCCRDGCTLPSPVSFLTGGDRPHHRSSNSGEKAPLRTLGTPSLPLCTQWHLPSPSIPRFNLSVYTSLYRKGRPTHYHHCASHSCLASARSTVGPIPAPASGLAGNTCRDWAGKRNQSITATVPTRAQFPT